MKVLVVEDSSSMRAYLTTTGGCARTCAAACAPQKHRLACHPSDVYVPFADDGFGALTGRHHPRTGNPWCGLAIDTSKPCDFLIDESCLLPYPSSRFLDADPATKTGLRVHYDLGSLPANSSGTMG